MARGLFDPARGPGSGSRRRGRSGGGRGGGGGIPGPEAAKGRRRILSVTELTRRVTDAIEERIGAVWVQGEVSNVSKSVSSHVYLTLKDEHSELRGVIWRSAAGRIGFIPADGEQVLAFGRMTVYGPRGTYQIIIERAEPIGTGALQRALEELKRRLAAEGLFDEAHKKPIPSFPAAVGVVTSSTGAALRDILKVMGRRWPAARVVVSPTRVQGEEAPAEIVEAIRRLERRGEVDVMIVGRGGGSIEDLWAFNDESVARAIFACTVPVVSAVGHEVDFTMADLVADLRAPTPSAAAERVVPDRAELSARAAELARRLPQALSDLIVAARDGLDRMVGRPVMLRPLELVTAPQQRVDELAQRLASSARAQTKLLEERLGGAAARLEGLSPLRVLGRGYSLTTREGEGVPITDASDVSNDEAIVTRFAKGRLRSRVLGAEE